MEWLLTYTHTWLSPLELPCLPTSRKVKRGGFNLCLHLASPVSWLFSTYSDVKFKVKGEVGFNARLYLGCGCNICLYLGFPSVMSFSTSRNVQRGWF